MTSDAAEQHFERGTMIWVKQEDSIYVLFDDDADDSFGPHWERYPDNWSEDMPDHDPSLVPPDGLYQPVRGFGLVWRESPEVRERLGWAVDQETAFTTTTQGTSVGLDHRSYIEALDGNVWCMEESHSSGSGVWYKSE